MFKVSIDFSIFHFLKISLRDVTKILLKNIDENYFDIQIAKDATYIVRMLRFLSIVNKM